MACLVTTVDLPDATRFAFWRDAVCDSFLHLDLYRTSDQPFFGEITTTRVGEVSFSHTRSGEYKVNRTPLQIRQASEEFLLISFQLSGTFSISQDGREANLEGGDFACIDSTRPYSAAVSDDFEQLLLHLPRDLWVRKFGPAEKVTARAVRGNTQMGALASSVLRQSMSIFENVESTTAHRLAEVALALVTAAFGDLILKQDEFQSTGRIALLYRAKVLIEENLHDPDLNPEKVARALRISERYLQCLFQDENMTVCSWIWKRRLEKSRRDLLDSLHAGKSVSQIAFDCGFSNFSHFSRRFRAAFGTSASEFRREQHLAAPQ